jgi:valyl-tRNA synthetase
MENLVFTNHKNNVCKSVIDIFNRYNQMNDKLTNNILKETNYNNLFIKLYEKKLIYKKNVSVKWCSVLEKELDESEIENIGLEQLTKLSIPIKKDGQIENKEYEFGKIYEIKYEIYKNNVITQSESYVEVVKKLKKEFIIIKTTRPELLLSEAAICIHSNNKDYKMYQGKSVINPLTNKIIPIIVDDDFVTINEIKRVVPFKNNKSYELSLKHNFECKNILDSCGFIECDKYGGQYRFDVLEDILNDLKLNDSLENINLIKLKLNICKENGNIVENRLVEKWFFDFSKLDKYLLSKISNINFINFNYNDDIIKNKEWSITYINKSNQNTIPLYHVKSNKLNIDDYIIANNKADANMIIEKDYSFADDLEIIENNNVYNNDYIECSKYICIENNLTDTENNNLLNKMIDMIVINDYEILIKSILLNLVLTDDIPYNNVYYVNKKMDIVNGDIDRLKIFDITILDDISNIFNKALNYLLDFEKGYYVEFDKLDLHNKWIIVELKYLNNTIINHMNDYNIEDSIKLLSEFWLIKMNKYLDYIETKIDKSTQLVLFNVLITCLKISHPFIPNLTQELYNILRNEQNELNTRKWPKFNPMLIDDEKDIIKQFSYL